MDNKVKLIIKYCINAIIKIINFGLHELIYGCNDTALFITLMGISSSFLLHIIYPDECFYIIGNLSFYFIVRTFQWLLTNISASRCLDILCCWFFIVIISTIILFPTTYF